MTACCHLQGDCLESRISSGPLRSTEFVFYLFKPTLKIVSEGLRRTVAGSEFQTADANLQPISTASTEHSVVHNFKGILNCCEIYKLRKLPIKSLRTLCVLGGSLLNASENTAKMVICIFCLLGES